MSKITGTIWESVIQTGTEELRQKCLADPEFAHSLYMEAIRAAKWKLENGKTSSTVVNNHIDYNYDDYPVEITNWAGITWEEKQKRHELRVKNCGKPSPRLNPLTGQFIWKPYFCGVYRECPTCRKRRAEKIKGEIEQYLYESDDDVFIFLLTDEQSKEITKGMSKSDFKKLPHPNNFDMVFISADAIEPDKISQNNGRKLDTVYIDSITDWERAVTTPQGRRMSGTLGKFSGSSEKSDEPTGKVEVKEILTNAPAHVETDAANKAERETKRLDPKTAEELQEAIQKRQDAFCKWLVAMGYKILLENDRKITVKIKRIKWIRDDENPRKYG